MDIEKMVKDLDDADEAIITAQDRKRGLIEAIATTLIENRSTQFLRIDTAKMRRSVHRGDRIK